MSMNLCFETVVGGHHIEFPFQSPTEMTFGVLKYSDPKDQCAELKRRMESYGWDDWMNLYLECEALILSPTLRLTYI